MPGVLSTCYQRVFGSAGITKWFTNRKLPRHVAEIPRVKEPVLVYSFVLLIPFLHT